MVFCHLTYPNGLNLENRKKINIHLFYQQEIQRKIPSKAHQFLKNQYFPSLKQQLTTPYNINHQRLIQDIINTN